MITNQPIDESTDQSMTSRNIKEHACQFDMLTGHLPDY